MKVNPESRGMHCRIPPVWAPWYGWAEMVERVLEREWLAPNYRAMIAEHHALGFPRRGSRNSQAVIIALQDVVPTPHPWDRPSLQPRPHDDNNKCRVGTTHCPLGKVHGICLGGGGKRYSQSRLHPGAIARYPRAREPPAYIEAWFSQEWETSKLATTRLLIFQLATPLVLCFFVFPPQRLFLSSSLLLLAGYHDLPLAFEICHEGESRRVEKGHSRECRGNRHCRE